MTSEEDSDKSSPSVAFDVILEGTASETRSRRLPKRLQQRATTKCEETDQASRIQEKQHRAEQKKKELEEARLGRIRVRREQCRRLATKMESLLAQEAKRQGAAGTAGVRPMSRREAGDAIRSVHRDFQQLGTELQQNLQTQDKG